MKSLEEIRQTSTYQNADDAGKAQIEQEYNKRYGNQGDASVSNNDRLVGQAKNLAQDVQNITNPNYETVKEIPEALPQTQNIKANAAPNDAPKKSWDQVINSNTYRNASDEDKYAMRQEYEKRGGVAQISNPSSLREVGDLARGVMGGISDTVLKTIPSVGVIAAEGVSRTDAVLNNMLGLDPNNSMLGNAARSTSQYLQDSMKSLNQQRAVQKNALGISNTSAGNLGGLVGSAGIQGAGIALSGGALAPVFATQAAGEHYTNSDNKNLATSLTVGGIQQLANELLPGSGGRVANAVEEGVSKFISPVASPTVNRILSSGMGKVAGAAETASLGATGGYGVGAGTALVEGKSLKEANEQGLESGKEGLAMGVGFHTATGAARFLSKPKVSSSAPKAFNQKVEDQTADIDNTVNSSGAERRAAFDSANERNTQAAHNIVEEAGLKSTQQTVKAGGLGEAAGVSDKAGDKAFADLEGVKQNFQDTVETFKQSTQSANSRNIEDVVNAVKPKVGDEAGTADNKKANEAVSLWQGLTKKRLSEQNKTNINYDKLNDLAEREHDAFLNMPKDAQDFVKSNWESPFNNNTKGYDPIAHTQEHIATDKYLDAVGNRVKSASDITDPSRLSKALKVIIPTGAHLSLWHHGGGIVEHGMLAGAEAGLGTMYSYGKNKIQQRKTAKVREEQLQAGKQATASINRAEGGVKTAHEAPETPLTEDTYREQRNQREQASIMKQKFQRDTEKANEIKKAFAGHEDLQDQITPQNYTDKQHISNLRSELAQRKATAKAAESAASKKSAEEAYAKANEDQVKEYKQANPHLKPFYSEATNELRKAGKDITLANFDKAVKNQMKGSKTIFKAGSKEELYQDVKDYANTTPEAKSKQRTIIDSYFNDKSKLNADGTLNTMQQGRLHKTLARVSKEELSGFPEEQSYVDDYWNKKSDRANKREELVKLSQQSDDVSKSIEDALKGSGLSERKSNRFTKTKMQELQSKGVMNRSDLESFKSQIKQEAEALKNGEPVKEKPSKSSSSVPVETPAIWANKDFDQPVYVVKHVENGMSLVKVAEIDNAGKITGYGKESYVPTKELVKAKSTKSEAPDESITKLSDTENNNIRNKYMSDIADSVGTDKFHNKLDEFETFIETHDLTDTSTSKKYHNWIETLARVQERKARGITDPEILLSSKEWADSVAPGTSLGNYLRHAVGKGGDWTPKLHANERASQEANNTPEKVAERKKTEALKRTQEQNRVEREKRSQRLKAKNLKVSR